MKAEIAYTSFRNNHQWGIRTRATYQNRQGIESLIGSASTNVYEKTGEAEQLSVKKADLSLSGVYGQTKGNRFTWYLSPKAGFNSFKMEYIDPARLMKINYLYGGMNLFAAAGYKKSSFQLVLDGTYRKNSTADLQLTEIDQEQIALAAVYKAYDNLSADQLDHEHRSPLELLPAQKQGHFHQTQLATRLLQKRLAPGNPASTLRHCFLNHKYLIHGKSNRV